MKKPSNDAGARAERVRRRRGARESVRVVRRKERRLRRSLAVRARRDYAARRGIPFDPVLQREQIVLPRVMSFYDNHDRTAAVLGEIREVALRRNRSIMLHFTDLDRIDPDVALVLVAEIFRIRNLRSREAVTGTYPRQRAIYELLRDMGFFSLLKVQELVDLPSADSAPGRPAYLRFLTDNRVVPEIADRFVDVIEKHIFSMSELARTRLMAAIIEAMTNTLDHAHPVVVANETMTHRWWLSSSVDPARREVTIMLFDQGVGIPATLDASRYERVRTALSNIVSLRSFSSKPTDGEMILAATELHRTRTGQEGRGKGFKDMKRFIDACDGGELKVLSNRGRYRYLQGTESHGEASSSIGGTVIEWRFRHQGKMEMADD